jgi:hypothetical protein
LTNNAVNKTNPTKNTLRKIHYSTRGSSKTSVSWTPLMPSVDPKREPFLSSHRQNSKFLFGFADLVVSNAVMDDEVQKVFDAGFSEKTVEDVIFAAAPLGFANRMVTGFGIHDDQERDQRSSRNLAQG